MKRTGAHQQPRARQGAEAVPGRVDGDMEQRRYVLGQDEAMLGCERQQFEVTAGEPETLHTPLSFEGHDFAPPGTSNR